jgi:sec-independent protein translocase protein TatA
LVLGQTELLVILLILLLLFGSTKLPELARSMGRAKREFREGMKEEEEPPKPVEAKKPEPKPEPKPTEEKVEAPAEGEKKPAAE